MATDDKFIKKANTKTSFTREQMDDLLKCMHPVDGPAYFMEHFVKIQHPVRGSIPFELYDYQRELIRCYHLNKMSIALISRQMGKTTVAAAYLLWYAMFVPDSFILIASKTGADALEIMGKVRFAYESLPDHIRAGVREYNKKSMLFDNGSRILSTTTTPNTGRGMAISLIYLDEFAFVEPHSVARELWTSLSPALSTGGKCIITSTPSSNTDQFAELWFGAIDTKDEYGHPRPNGLGRNGFASYFATWRANPERDETWAANERAKIGDDRFRREHENEFIVFEETLVDSVFMNGIKKKDPIEIHGNVRWYECIDPSYTYVACLDPSMGTGGDNAAITVWELPTMCLVAEWMHNKTPIEGQMRILKDILDDIWVQGQPELYWSLESNSIGEAALVVIRDTGEENFSGTFLHDPNRYLSAKQRRKGFVTTNKTKLEGCAKVKQWIEKGKMTLSSANLIDEFKNFISRGNSFRAKDGCSDDLVMSTILFARMAIYISTWDEGVYEVINGDINNYDEDDESQYVYDGDDEGEDYPMPMII